MNYNKFSYKVRPQYLLNIPLLILILGLRLSIYLTETEDYVNDISAYTELALSERSDNKPLLTTYNFNVNSVFYKVIVVPVHFKYKNAILSYNHLVITEYKNLDSNPVFNSSIISILKHNNICNKSPEEKPSIIC